MQVPDPACQVRGYVSPTHTLQHLSCLCKWVGMWCAPRLVVLFVMVDDIIYMGISPVGNLKNHDLREVNISFASYYE